MSRYIDAEKLIAEIDRQEIGCNTDGKHTAEYNTCRKILDIITSLQQEQAEVDLENYIGTARIYKTPKPVILTVSELEWCKAALQKRIDLDRLQDQIDWGELQISLKQCGEDEWKRLYMPILEIR